MMALASRDGTAAPFQVVVVHPGVGTYDKGVTRPLCGRLADRHGLTRVSAACGGLHTLALRSLLAGAPAEFSFPPSSGL